MHLSQTEAFALTIAVESVAAIVVAPSFRIARWQAALSAVLGSSVTHPLLWYSFYQAYELLGVATTPVLEAFVMLIEALFYRFIARVTWLEALLLSVIVNASSWIAGEIIYSL